MKQIFKPSSNLRVLKKLTPQTNRLPPLLTNQKGRNTPDSSLKQLYFTHPTITSDSMDFPQYTPNQQFSQQTQYLKEYSLLSDTSNQSLLLKDIISEAGRKFL